MTPWRCRVSRASREARSHMTKRGAPSPWTVPSHFAVFTGVDPWHVTVRSGGAAIHGTEADARAAVPRPRLRDAAIIANPTVSRESGFGAGFDEFTASRASGVCRSAIGDLLSRLWLHDLPRSPLCGWLIAPEITDHAVRFIRRTRRPYFLTLNYMDAHDPYYVPVDCGPHPLRRAEHVAYLDGDLRLAARAREQYRAAMRCMDRSLGTLFAALERDPDYATTTVIAVGDHGEQFGELGKTRHGNSVYRPVLQVPLIVRIPGQKAARLTSPISITDIHPMLLGLSARRPVVSFYQRENEGAFSAVVGDHQLIRDRDGHETVFVRNGGEADPAAVRAARNAINRELAAQRGTGEFRALGYLQ
jgi:hypothetical protein